MRNSAAVSNRRLFRICYLVLISLVLVFCGLKSVRLVLLSLLDCVRAKLLSFGGCWETV